MYINRRKPGTGISKAGPGLTLLLCCAEPAVLLLLLLHGVSFRTGQVELRDKGGKSENKCEVEGGMDGRCERASERPKRNAPRPRDTAQHTQHRATSSSTRSGELRPPLGPAQPSVCARICVCVKQSK